MSGGVERPWDQVLAFLPITQLERIARHACSAERTAVDHGWGAVLTIDVSGFSVLAERHAREGARGTEALSEVVHQLFGTITEAVLDRGGDVLYHAGDAVCALFSASDDPGRDDTCRRAVAAALDVQDRLGASADATGVRIRAAVGCGETHVWEVGGVEGDFVLLVQGPAIVDNARVDQLSAEGVVSVSETVFARLGAAVRGGITESGVCRVHRLDTDIPIARRTVALAPDRLPAVLGCLPPAVRARFESGDPPPSAEFRPVSTVFASLPEVDLADPGVRVALQQSVVTLQAELGRLGRPQLEVLGDKGLGFVVEFGLPPLAYDDDAVRAVEAAFAIRSAFEAHGMTASIGVATGVVWAGPSGAEGRYCYDVVGSVSIRAARLMQSAVDEVLTCGTTRRLAERSFAFAELPPRVFKGFQGPQVVARPSGRRTSRSRPRTRLAGRDHELRRIDARLDAAMAGRGGVVMVEADPGMGKSVLAETMRDRAATRGALVLSGAAESIETATPYFAVRGAVLDLLGIAPGSSLDALGQRVVARLRDDAPELAWLAPLLEAIIPLDLRDSAESAQIVGTTRAERLGDLVVALVRGAAARRPVVWCVEDLHWADRASWALCRRLVDEVPAVLMLGTCRPMSAPPPDRERLLTGEGRELVVLADLGEQALGEVVSMRLGVSRLPTALLSLIAARADGNPFFAEEIALAAREAGGVVVVGDEVRIERPLETLDLPTSITGVITSRIDRLDAAARTALRCAAVLGSSFDVRTLAAVLGEEAAGTVHATVSLLADATFLDSDPTSRHERGYRFRHAFLHETAYAQLTFAERRTLHAAAATVIEADPHVDLPSVTALLAHHWEIAERAEQAAHYYGVAGAQALDADANLECVAHLTKALRFDETVRGALDVDVTRARWTRMLLEASYSLGQHEAARAWGEKVFAYCGLRVPRHAGHVLASLGRHAVRRYVPPTLVDEETRARYAEALVASSTLQTVAMWAGDRVGQLGLAVYADVISATCGPTPERAVAQGSMGLILLVVGMRDVGLRDMGAAVRIADELGDRPAQISTKVILGLGLSSLGRNREALAPLAEARHLAERVGSGLWRHRALFQSGEPHYQLGLLDDAYDLFDRCVGVARKVEPPVAGMSRAMQAACRLRAGATPDEALALLARPDGLVVAEPGPTMMALVALGVHAWSLLVAGQYEASWVSARKCLVLVDKESDDAIAFARAVDGHAHTALVLTRLWELRRDGVAGVGALPPTEELARDAQRAVSGLARLARRWPAAQPLAALLEAYHLRLRGARAGAGRALERAATLAANMEQPFERALALSALARDHGRPSNELATLVQKHGLGGVTAGYFPV